jgi:hypothetical protein
MNKPKRVLSLGAGVQSTTLLLMALHGEIEPLDAAIFADTGWEPKAVYEHLKYLQGICQEHDLPLHIVSKGNIRADALNHGHRFATMPIFIRNDDNSKGMARRQCTAEYKVAPVVKLQRELAGLQPRQRSKEHLLTSIIGISLDEYQRMRDAPFPWLHHEYPLVDMGITREQCLKWVAEKGYNKPPRSACIGCPYKQNSEWRLLKDEAPDEWADAVAFDYAIRGGYKREGARLDGQMFLHRSLIPLDEVDLSTPQERGIWGLFDDECQGMCGN